MKTIQRILLTNLIALAMIISSLQAQHTMTAGTYALTGSITYYDPGGAGGTTCPGSGAGNYADNLNIIETITANSGQRIVLTFVGGTFGIANLDHLYVYDGPSTASPLLANYTNTTNPIPSILGATTSNSITFQFTSDASGDCKGWQATVAAFYYMQPGSYSFSCPGTYTFLDPQNANSGGSGGDATCVANGNSKDYQDNLSMIESFTTTNGQCIQIDGSFPSSFGICSLDTLTVYDGPSILSPIANSGTAIYTNTWANPPTFPTLGGTVTFKFFSDANNTHTRGWQIGLSCVACPSASINDLCANAIVLTPSASCNSLPSSTSVSNSNSGPFLAPTCTGTNTANDDVWYRFTPNNSSTQITVAPTDATMDPVIQLFSGTCGSFTSLYCQNATGVNQSETLSATGLTAGTTYYFRVYDANATNASHTFNVCVVGTANTDCQGALQICSTASLQHTAQGYPDFGVQEYNGQYWGCDLSGEIRSAWYYFQLASSGTFGFTISALPGSSYMDNDFVLWGPLSGLDCPMNTNPIRCDYSIGYSSNSYGLPPYSTGLQSAEGDQISSSGGNAFVQTVNGSGGQWYVLLVNTLAGPNSYNITWMDNIPANQQATFASCGCAPPTSGEAAISANGNTTFCTGDNVVLAVATPGLTYQWKNGGAISGATNQSYSATTSGSYQCDVSNACGTTSSNIIIVTVNSAPTAADAHISAAGSTTFCFGSNVTLSVATSGQIYQWIYNGSTVSGATNQSFSATASGIYQCDVSNNCGDTTSNTITVTVSNAPTTSQAAISANGSTTICNGASVVLSVATSGLTYQWKRNGTAISGATNQNYSATMGGSYKCNVSNSCGSTPSNVISVTVGNGPTAAEAMISANGATTFCTGGNVVLSVATSGLIYQWKNSGSTISGATNQSFTATTSGSYTCDVSNSCGPTTSNTIIVTTSNGPSASEAAITPTDTISCGNVILTVATGGLTYQWKKGGTNISGATSQSITAATSGTYSCNVTNSCGTTTSNSISVTVSGGPSAAEAEITAQGPTTFCSGNTVVELVVATSGLTYQWKKNNNIISGANLQSYSASKTATYKCDVSNSCGTTTSNSISVTVNTSPTASITQSPCSNSVVLLTCNYTPASGVTFKWKKGGAIISGATNSTYSATATATYKCIVTITASGCSKTSSGSNVTISCKAGDVVDDYNVIVYPNPTSDYFNINTSQLDVQSEMDIYDLLGRLVEHHRVTGYEMQVGESLANGVYFLKIVTNNKTQEVIKLVKNF